MIGPVRAEQIRQSLIRGVSHRQIARRFAVSIRTISRIAAELHASLDDDAQLDMERGKRARRCPSCGWLIYVWPCLNCRLQGTGVASTRAAGRFQVTRVAGDDEMRKSA